LDNLSFTIACAALGAVAGFLGGLLGIGGGVVIVPSLILLFDAIRLESHGAPAGNGTTLVAVATSLATIVFTSIAAARPQIRAQMVEWRIIRRWTAFVVLGSFGASTLAALMPMITLRTSIAAFLFFVAFVMLTSWKPSPHRALPGTLGSAVLGTVGGLIAGMAGIGGGNVVVPTLVYHNVPVHRATATASVLGIPIALAGSLGYVQRGFGETTLADGFIGYVYLPAFLAIAVASIATAPLGVRTAHRLQPQPLRRAFGALLLVVAARMLWSAFG
jgi:uncharacterized membrane protein YfcA